MSAAPVGYKKQELNEMLEMSLEVFKLRANLINPFLPGINKLECFSLVGHCE